MLNLKFNAMDAHFPVGCHTTKNTVVNLNYIYRYPWMGIIHTPILLDIIS